MSSVARKAGEWGPALVVFVLVIVAWEGGIALFHVQQFLLPRPSDIVKTFFTDRHVLWPAGWYTFKEALGGFAIGSTLGILAATLVGRFKTVGAAFMPIAIAANAVPIIAFAPIFAVWFNPLSPASKMAIAAVLCFLPVMVNTLRGLQSASPRQIELMRSYAASDLEIWRRVRVPTALPYVFTALKVASVLAMIGAIVGDYFGGSNRALGIQIENSISLFDFPFGWAAIVVASAFGLVFYVTVGTAERLALRGVPSTRD